MPSLEDKIAAAQDAMVANLAETRATFEQSGNKGTAAEDAFRDFLRKYLPRNLGIGHGEVIDTFGKRSRQSDVVIASEDHPFTFTEKEPGLFFVEGVVAVGEVKSLLTRNELAEACAKAAMFNELRMSHMRGSVVTTNPSDLARFYECPPFFLLAYESQLRLETAVQQVIAAQRAAGAPVGRFLDALFLLGRGWAADVGDGEGAVRGMTEDGKPATGWIYHASDHVLFDLLGWLSAVMPRFVRFQPILLKYLELGRGAAAKADPR